MLVIDDYNELIAIETLFRRVGFDVLSIGRDVLVNDALLRFHPDIVVATAKGRSVDGLKLASRLNRLTPVPRVALVHPIGFQLPQDAKYVDGLLESPVKAKSALGVIANLANLDPVGLLEKFDKLSAARHARNKDGIVVLGENRPTDSVTTVSSRPAEESNLDPILNPGQAATTRTDRSNRYDKFLAENNEEPEFKTLAHDKVKAAMKKLAKDSAKDKDELDRLDREKREFAKAMFSGSESKDDTEDDTEDDK